MSRITRRGFLQATAAIAALGILPARSVAAQEAVDTALAIKTAATDFLLGSGFSQLPPASRADLAALVGDYALVYVYPPPGTGEIARVVTQWTASGWVGLTYGGIFPDAESRMGAPERLFLRTPYFSTVDDGEERVDPRDPGRQLFQDAGLSFEYPGDAKLSFESDLPGPGAVAIVADSYRIDLQPLDVTVDQLLDDWAYDWYTANVQYLGGPAVSPTLIQYSTALAVNNAYQVDRPDAQGIVSDFLVAPKLGGNVVLVRTTGPERPVDRAADSSPDPQVLAVQLLLDSLRIGEPPASEQGCYADTVAGFAVSFPPEWWGARYATSNGFTLFPPDGQSELWFSALAADSLDAAVERLPVFQSEPTDPPPPATEATIGGWDVRFYDFERQVDETSYQPSRVYYVQVQPDVVLLVQVSGDLGLGDGIIASVTPVERQRA